VHFARGGPLSALAAPDGKRSDADTCSSPRWRLGGARSGRGVEGTQLGERRIGLLTLHVVRQKPMELLVHERPQLSGVIVDIARIEGEHRMTVRDHARLNQGPRV